MLPHNRSIGIYKYVTPPRSLNKMIIEAHYDSLKINFLIKSKQNMLQVFSVFHINLFSII